MCCRPQVVDLLRMLYASIGVWLSGLVWNSSPLMGAALDDEADVHFPGKLDACHDMFSI